MEGNNYFYCVQRQMRQPAAPEVLGKGLKNQL